MNSFTIRLRFHGDLPFFLGSKISTVERRLSEKTSVKDVIEACGVPHTEVDLIVVNGRPVNFAATLAQDVGVDIYPPNQARSLLWENLSEIFACSASTSFTIQLPKIDNSSTLLRPRIALSSPATGVC